MDVTPLSSISTSGVDATPCPDTSVARSVSVGPGTSMSVDFDDHDREITAAAMLELADSTPTVHVHSPGIPSIPSAIRLATLSHIINSTKYSRFQSQLKSKQSAYGIMAIL